MAGPGGGPLPHATRSGSPRPHGGPGTRSTRLASLLGRHDVADQYLNTAFEIVDAFDWDYHRAAILMARAAARHRSSGQIDDAARAWLETAAGICVVRGLIAPFARVARSTNRSTPYHGDHRLPATECYRRPRLPVLYGAHLASRQGDAFPMLQTVSARRFAGKRMANRDH
jgi:hypothetical protein